MTAGRIPTAGRVPGVSVEATVTVTSWADLGDNLANRTSIDQCDFVGAFAEVLVAYPLQIAILAERILLQEKDNSDMRATREAVQRFCRELLENLDEGSR